MKEIRKSMTILAVFLLVASTAAALPTATNIVINDASGNPNTFVNVPVNITNVLNEPIAGIVLDISFNSSVINLTANRVEKGDLTSAWDSPSFNPANGRLSIVFKGAGTEIPVGSSGSIVILNFSVVGAPGSSVMNINAIQLSNKDGDIGTASAENGTFTIPGQVQDILSYYRGLGNDPNVVETTDLLRAADDWSNNVAPQGFASPITTQQLLGLADEWSST
jgi:hypothetical protein